MIVLQMCFGQTVCIFLGNPLFFFQALFYQDSVDFFYENMMMQNNLLMSASKYKIKRIVYLGSSCIYPRQTKTPIKEEQLLTGKLEKTNEAYALAKISGIKLSPDLPF